MSSSPLFLLDQSVLADERQADRSTIGVVLYLQRVFIRRGSEDETAARSGRSRYVHVRDERVAIDPAVPFPVDAGISQSSRENTLFA